MGFNAFDHFMFSYGSIIIGIVFFLVISVFVFIIVTGISQWTKNNNSPKLTVPAEVITKRTKTSGGNGDSSASTWYYVTFQVESGDRMELGVRGNEFGMLAEGDVGMLTFQGTRYLEFERIQLHGPS
ncbi:DUF2500 domain-containing protein [Sporosarcina sp. 179-K 3D1 HS]|uniref:DUF2500 domain-containing protein n=1 Tax=Sporosarcina sp. 179-K 3D1 HS TaxID=3232169 RepID=UPI00399F5E7A